MVVPHNSGVLSLFNILAAVNKAKTAEYYRCFLYGVFNLYTYMTHVSPRW